MGVFERIAVVRVFGTLSSTWGLSSSVSFEEVPRLYQAVEMVVLLQPERLDGALVAPRSGLAGIPIRRSAYRCVAMEVALALRVHFCPDARFLFEWIRAF